jgi:hypothetical protein
MLYVSMSLRHNIWHWQRLLWFVTILVCNCHVHITKFNNKLLECDIFTWWFRYWTCYWSEVTCIGPRRSRSPIQLIDSGMTCYLLDTRHHNDVFIKTSVDTGHVQVVTTLCMLESSCQNQFRWQSGAKHLQQTYRFIYTYNSDSWLLSNAKWTMCFSHIMARINYILLSWIFMELAHSRNSHVGRQVDLLGHIIMITS